MSTLCLTVCQGGEREATLGNLMNRRFSGQLNRRASAGSQRLPGLHLLPHTQGVRKTRDNFTKVLKDVAQGETYLVKGPKGRDALIISVDLFRELQDSYLALVSELETRKIVEDEEAMEKLRAADESEDYLTLSEVEEHYGE